MDILSVGKGGCERQAERGLALCDVKMGSDLLPGSHALCEKSLLLCNTAFTIGIWRPIIFYPAKRSSKEVELILEHELQHVKNRDVFWRMLLVVVKILHFYNPFIWFFAEEFEIVREMASAISQFYILISMEGFRGVL